MQYALLFCFSSQTGMMSLTVNKDCVLHVSDSDNKKVKICGPITLTLDKAENVSKAQCEAANILKNVPSPSSRVDANERKFDVDHRGTTKVIVII